MLDLSSAVVLVGVIVGLVSLTRSAVFGTAKDRLTVGLVLVISIVAVLLVAASDFASEQVVINRPLDSLSFLSQIVVAILLAGGGSALWEGLKAVKNVGENAPPS